MAYKKGVIPLEVNKLLEERDSHLKTREQAGIFKFACPWNMVCTVSHPDAVPSAEVIGYLLDNFPDTYREMIEDGDPLFCEGKNMEEFLKAWEAYKKSFKGFGWTKEASQSLLKAFRRVNGKDYSVQIGELDRIILGD